MKWLPIALSCLIGCSESRPPESPNTQVIDDSDFEKMGTPKPGEWLHSFKEEHQTFEDYKKNCYNCRTKERWVIYIQPLGDMDEIYTKILPIMREYAELFFNCKAVLKEKIEIFEDCYDKSRKQYNASSVTNRLKELIPGDAIAFIGITKQDLYSEGLNFVFGLASLVDRTGIYSLRRLETIKWPLFLRRSLQLMAHETGHIFSIPHCIKYKCVMNGANSLSESDSHPLHICPVDLPKLQWNTGFDIFAWYERLFEYYKRNELKEEADWVEKHLKKLK